MKNEVSENFISDYDKGFLTEEDIDWALPVIDATFKKFI